MSSLRKNDRGYRPPIFNTKLGFLASDQAPSEVKKYYLSPEELEKYREGDKDMAPKTIPIPQKEEIKSVLERYHGNLTNSQLHLKVKGTATFHNWLEHYDLKDYAKQLREKNKAQQNKGAERKPANTPTPTCPEPVNTLEEIADAYIIIGDGEYTEFNSLEKVKSFITSEMTLFEAGKARLFKEVPFNMRVNVEIGKVS